MHRTVDSSTVRERGRAARTISAPQRTTPSKQHPPTYEGTEVTHKHKHTNTHTQTHTHTHTHDNNKTPPVQDRYATRSGGEHVDVLDDHNAPSPRYKTNNKARAAMATANTASKHSKQTQQTNTANYKQYKRWAMSHSVCKGWAMSQPTTETDIATTPVTAVAATTIATATQRELHAMRNHRILTNW